MFTCEVKVVGNHGFLAVPLRPDSSRRPTLRSVLCWLDNHSDTHHASKPYSQMAFLQPPVQNQSQTLMKKNLSLLSLASPQKKVTRPTHHDEVRALCRDAGHKTRLELRHPPLPRKRYYTVMLNQSIVATSEHNGHASQPTEPPAHPINLSFSSSLLSTLLFPGKPGQEWTL
jgi:hypothetical protein